MKLSNSIAKDCDKIPGYYHKIIFELFLYVLLLYGLYARDALQSREKWETEKTVTKFADAVNCGTPQ